MKHRFKGEIPQYNCIDIYQPHARVVGHQVTYALATKLAVAVLGLVEGTDVFFALDNFHAFLWPKSGRIDWGGSSGCPVLAVTVAHFRRSPCHFDFNGAAKAAAFVCGFTHFLSFENTAFPDMY